MAKIDPAYEEGRRKYWTRHDAHLWVRHDAWRFMPPGSPMYTGGDVVKYGEPSFGRPAEEELRRAQAEEEAFQQEVAELRAALAELNAEIEAGRQRQWRETKRLSDLRWLRFLQKVKAGFNPDQPRVPAGNPDGGQWTNEGGGSDATDLSANRRRPAAGGLSGGTPAQQARLAVAEARAKEAIRRVHELDPRWRPTPSLHETIEGRIAAAEAEAREAQSRLDELSRVGIGAGPFSGESIPARGPERVFTRTERDELNRVGSESGCHTCGTTNPGTSSGNFVADHQPPSALNYLGKAQRLYPHCLTCSLRQGAWITNRGSKQ
jgi:hypothetical protein